MAKTMGDLFEALGQVGAEVQRAREKFPGSRHLMAALAEEVGELAKELLERGAGPTVRGEAMQVACVAVRIMTEGDDDFSVEACTPKIAPKPAPQRPAKKAMAKKTLNVQRSTSNAQVKDGEAPHGATTNGPAAATMICPDCGTGFVKTGRNQKRCPECAGAKKKEWQAERNEERRNPAATAERLAAIKAADKRLDTIPDAGSTGV
jgi:hypothetical protein